MRIPLVLLLSLSAFAIDMPGSLREGQTAAQQAIAENSGGVVGEAYGFKSFKEMDVKVTDNPKEAGFSTSRLRFDADRAKNTDETYQIIAENQEHRNHQGFSRRQ